jgi:hypothetical protein
MEKVSLVNWEDAVDLTYSHGYLLARNCGKILQAIRM